MFDTLVSNALDCAVSDVHFDAPGANDLNETEKRLVIAIRRDPEFGLFVHNYLDRPYPVTIQRLVEANPKAFHHWLNVAEREVRTPRSVRRQVNGVRHRTMERGSYADMVTFALALLDIDTHFGREVAEACAGECWYYLSRGHVRGRGRHSGPTSCDPYSLILHYVVSAHHQLRNGRRLSTDYIEQVAKIVPVQTLATFGKGGFRHAVAA